MQLWQVRVLFIFEAYMCVRGLRRGGRERGRGARVVVRQQAAAAARPPRRRGAQRARPLLLLLRARQHARRVAGVRAVLNVNKNQYVLNVPTTVEYVQN